MPLWQIQNCGYGSSERNGTERPVLPYTKYNEQLGTAVQSSLQAQ